MTDKLHFVDVLRKFQLPLRNDSLIIYFYDACYVHFYFLRIVSYLYIIMNSKLVYQINKEINRKFILKTPDYFSHTFLVFFLIPYIHYKYNRSLV